MLGAAYLTKQELLAGKYFPASRPVALHDLTTLFARSVPQALYRGLIV
jgi:hypothetical protein